MEENQCLLWSEEKENLKWYLPNAAIDFASFDGRKNRCDHISLHCHDYYEVELTVSGSMVNTVNGSAKRMERGDFLFLSVGDSHRIDIEDDLLIYKLNFRPDAFWHDMGELISRAPLPLIGHFEEDELAGFIQDFERSTRMSHEKQDDFSNVLLRIAAEGLLIQVLKKLPVMELPRLPEAVREGMRYIRAHCRENIRITDIASFVCLSPDHFSHLFVRYTSISPKTYQRDCRMQAARELLIETELPVAEIAARVGYSSLSLFYRHIKETFDKMPTEIRRGI